MKVKKIHGLGNHLTIEGFCDNKNKLNNKKLIKNILNDLPKKIGMKKISKATAINHIAKNKEENGITGFVILAESHICIHTYPEKNYFLFDLFSCKEFEVNKIINYLKNKLSIKKIKKNLIRRGFYETR